MRQLFQIIADREPLIMARTATVQSACQQMMQRRTGSVLITDDSNTLTGIFTGRDAVFRVLAAGKGAVDTILLDVMTPDPIAMAPNDTAIEALRVMWDRGFRHMPVVENGDPLGVVSTGDFEGLELDLHEYERHLWENT